MNNVSVTMLKTNEQCVSNNVTSFRCIAPKTAAQAHSNGKTTILYLVIIGIVRKKYNYTNFVLMQGHFLDTPLQLYTPAKLNYKVQANEPRTLLQVSIRSEY